MISSYAGISSIEEKEMYDILIRGSIEGHGDQELAVSFTVRLSQMQLFMFTLSSAPLVSATAQYLTNTLIPVYCFLIYCAGLADTSLLVYIKEFSVGSAPWCPSSGCM
jgi:hypothetical protein